MPTAEPPAVPVADVLEGCDRLRDTGDREAMPGRFADLNHRGG